MSRHSLCYDGSPAYLVSLVIENYIKSVIDTERRLLRWIAVIMMRKDQSTSTFIMSFTPEAGC
jgi:hypothetical protein